MRTGLGGHQDSLWPKLEVWGVCRERRWEPAQEAPVSHLGSAHLKAGTGVAGRAPCPR